MFDEQVEADIGRMYEAGITTLAIASYLAKRKITATPLDVQRVVYRLIRVKQIPGRKQKSTTYADRIERYGPQQSKTYPGSNLGWTDKRVARLRELWTDGHSASAIASDLGGISRNAVIGKARRLKLPPHVNTSRGREESLVARIKRKRVNTNIVNRSITCRPVAAATLPRKDPMPLPEISPDDVALITGPIIDVVTALTSKTCHWPIGDPKTPSFGYCGCATVEGQEYCAGHLLRKHQ